MKHNAPARGPRAWRRRMLSRDPGEEHRVATPLELLFDLCFVVAIAQASSRLHHGLAEGHGSPVVLGYAMVFFAIWWAWMNFSWFASAYDTDDVPYRLLVLLQIVGVLILAAGVPRAFDNRDFTVVTAGYVVMRIGLVALWVRAARADTARRATAVRYAFGVSACQVGWIAVLFLPADVRLAAFVILVAAELAVPLWAERATPTSWHPHHIAERYGLLTLIVLGESVLSATLAIQSALDAGHATSQLIEAIVGAPLIIFSMWWLYFDEPAHHFLVSNRVGFVWGYGHLLIFGSAAAVGAGLAVVVDQATGHAHLPAWSAGATVAVPVAVYLLSLWVMHVRPQRRGLPLAAAYPLTAALVLGAAASAWPVVVIGLLLAALVTLCVVTGGQRIDRSSAAK